MSKPDDYRANAKEYQRMAAISHKPNEKTLWQQMAQQWLGMIPKVESPKSDHSKPANVACRPRPKSRRTRLSELNKPNSIESDVS
jgi:hypothetical protein